MKWRRQNQQMELPASESTAVRIAGWMLRRQQAFARVMNHQFSKLDLRGRKVALLFFCLFSCGVSGYAIYQALAAKSSNPLQKIGRFSLPRVENPREEESREEVFIDQDTWKRVDAFKRYMDSLKASGDPEYDRILAERPGLMDSVCRLEEIYHLKK